MLISLNHKKYGSLKILSLCPMLNWPENCFSITIFMVGILGRKMEFYTQKSNSSSTLTISFLLSLSYRDEYNESNG